MLNSIKVVICKLTATVGWPAGCWKWGRGGGSNKFVATATAHIHLRIVGHILVAVDLQEAGTQTWV